jgi:hypothetical protein
MRQEHKKLGVWVEIPDPLLQRHVEALFKGIREIGLDPEKVSSPEYNGGLVEAAQRLGWCPGPIGDMRPAAVTWIARKINDTVAEALDIPPE